MIYSDDINKICGLCQSAELSSTDADMCYCTKKRKNFEITKSACRKFKYDILKKPAHRRRKLKTDFDPDDFKL